MVHKEWKYSGIPNVVTITQQNYNYVLVRRKLKDRWVSHFLEHLEDPQRKSFINNMIIWLLEL